MNGRDISIDILRGLAIFTMIAANMAAHSLAEPHGFGFRLYGSLAAPLFILISGYMVAFTSKQKAHKLGYYIKRALLVYLVAVLIDVLIWGTLPFLTFDVLYLIALSMPLIYLFLKLHRGIQLGIIVLIIGLTPVLQHHFGYHETAEESAILELTSFSAIFQGRYLPQFFLDGWFPIFPWLAVSLLGGFFGALSLEQKPEVFRKTLLIAGSSLLSTGLVSWIILKPNLLTRDGYSELFYPPGPPYLLTFLGFILLLFPLARKFQQQLILKLLSVYGRSSLLVYILHTVLIVYVINLLPAFNAGIFTILYLGHALVLWVICFLIQKLLKDKKPPFIVSFLLGK